MIKGKEKLKNQYLIDFLSTKALIQKNKIKGSIISINEISYRVFALYWQIEINKNNSEIGHSILNDIQYNLISKYGLSRDSNVDEIEQVLNYIDDKSVQIKLYGIIKFSLTCLSNPYNSTKFVNYIINKLKGIDIEKKEILQINKNISIKIDSDWSNYFKNNDTFIKEIENKIIELEEGNFVDELEPKLETKDNKEDFNRLFELEKKMKFYMKIDKEKYACLEEAFAWMDMNIENYKKIHNTYITYTKENSFKKIKLELPLVTSAMLIYTAIYRYNDEDASGFWPEFFGNKDGYNYVYDVLPTMECISYVIEEYGIYGDKRKYLQKKNLAEIFSQIYLPEVSLVKILSAIYKAYFRGNTFNRLVNKIDFIEKNDYILDKPGSFFISEDNIIEDVFYDLVDLVRDGIKGIESNNERLPKRFYISFEKWLKEDKKEMDKYKEDYYIANPRIIIDTINEEIKIYLPKQKSRGYSDETISWNLTIDDIKKTIEGRVIRQRDGAYLILEEKLKIKKFKKILIEFIFNDEKLGTWEFTNDKKYMIFDKHRTLLNKDNVNRDGCFIAIPKDFKLEINEVFNRYEILGWKDYMFYYLELAEYQGERLIINKEIDIPIEEQPVVDSKDFELLFENPNYKSINESVNIYKKFGSYEIISPFINKDCIHIIFDEIEEKKSKVDFIEINQTSKNKVELNIDQELLSGVYSIFIKYKNKSIYRESFIVDKFSKVKQEYILSYNNEENDTKEMRIYNDSDIEIHQYDYRTKVKRFKSEYIIETEKASVARFIYKRGDSEVLIRQIVKPIKLELTGLEEVIEPVGRNKVKEITKEVLNSKDINLYVKNLDSKYSFLNYELVFIDNISGSNVSISENIIFGDGYDWNFKELKDRLVDFKNIDVCLKIRNIERDIIYEKALLKIKEYIDIYNFESYKINKDKLLIKWEEIQNNSQRRISLHNLTKPSHKELEYDLDDGITELELDLNKLENGVYMPLLEFKKRNSLFSSIESNIEFFERFEVENIFIVSNDETNSQGTEALSKAIWFMYEEKYEKLYSTMENLHLEEIELYDVLSTVVQMKYFTKNTKESKQVLLDYTYYTIKLLLKKYRKKELVRNIMGFKNILLRKDLSYLLSSVLTFEKAYTLDAETTDLLLDFYLISALLSLENGKNKLSNQMIKESKEQFDHELLGLDVIHNYERIFDIIENEMNIINEFWSWLTDYKNSYLLKYQYSKARLFRMYVDENEIFTYKVLGRTIDDLVDSMTGEDRSLYSKIPNIWSNSMNVEREIYEKFIQLINKNIQTNYINVLKAAFISVTRFSEYSDKEYFDLIMKSELSHQKEIFNRYRAYFKLIFI